MHPSICESTSGRLDSGHNLIPSERFDSNMKSNKKKLVSPSSQSRKRKFTNTTIFLFGLLAFPTTSAQKDPPLPKCISLATSKMCPAFRTSQISVDKWPKFPFLKFVNDTEQFDTEFERYIRTDYPVQKFQNVFGCVKDSFANTTNLYARYTRSQLCSAMIQESIEACQLTQENAKPLCLEDCGYWASSEWQIVSNKETCGDTKVEYDKLVRSDFIICTLPDNSFKRNLCINADTNEGENCGFSDNLPGLCLHCQGGTANTTETCCYQANVEERCKGVKLPDIRDVPDDLLPTPSNVPGADKKKDKGISGGVIAGIVIGGVAVVALIGFFLLWWRRKRQRDAAAMYLNRPNPRRTSPPERNMQYNNPALPVTPQNPPGGRIARMSALESNSTSMSDPNSPPMPLQERPSHRVIRNTSRDFDLQDSPDTRRSAKYTPDHRPLHPPPRDRNASLSSTSILVSERQNQSDSEKEDNSQHVSSPLSEQLPYFKDYYSKDDIHPNDKVSVLWAYSPRAPDEFELERGDMLRVIGIWDDGWATGVRLNERAEDYARTRGQRDSGISASQLSRASVRPSTPPGNREVKAFPLVCVCLPQHWQKTIDNDGIDYTSTHTTEGQLSDPESTPGKRIQKEPSSRFREDMNPREGPSSP